MVRFHTIKRKWFNLISHKFWYRDQVKVQNRTTYNVGNKHLFLLGVYILKKYDTLR